MKKQETTKTSVLAEHFLTKAPTKNKVVLQSGFSVLTKKPTKNAHSGFFHVDKLQQKPRLLLAGIYATYKISYPYHPLG